MKKITRLSALIFLFLAGAVVYADQDERLYQTALPYIKYFNEHSLDSASGFAGMTRSFQIYLGGHNPEEEAVINYGAAAYDQSLLARINLAGGSTAILDTYLYYAARLDDSLNPALNTNGNYYDANLNPLKNGPYRIIRILGRWDWPDWWSGWDWIVDTGAASCLIIDSLEAYSKTSNADYRNFAILLGDYILELQDTDGGIRYGPRGMFHDPEPQSDFYWNLKSTEQNERALCAFQALYNETQEAKYLQAAQNIQTWLKGMYDFNVHLFSSAASYNGTAWIKSDFSYVATDVTAFAPLDIMFEDNFFGSSQETRDQEVDAMFLAIEGRTAFFDTNGLPNFFRFSVSQVPDPVKGDYGSVEVSSQMALAYLRAAQNYSGRNEVKTSYYLNRYNSLVAALNQFFSHPAEDPSAKVAPYASFLDASVAGGVPTGTGYYTYNCQAALASCYYAFASCGYDPSKPGGGPGIPQSGATLNLTDVTWYQNTAYNSTGAAVSQMIINYMRSGESLPALAQLEIYEYARSPEPPGEELTPQQIDKALGHFDPYDSIVSNWADHYDSYADGNPFQGYNFTVDAYNPSTEAQAANEYMRDICHWMAYPVTREDWWLDGPLVARPHTPAAIPIYGSYNNWVAVKGFAASANPCPYPHTDPFDTPDFTVYGFWFKDPRIDGIGKDTYKTASECLLTYFLPLSTSDAYNGMYLQVAEPPPVRSRAKSKIKKADKDPANLEFINSSAKTALSSSAKIKTSGKPFKKKTGWQDIIDKNLLNDPEALKAFSDTQAQRAVFVKRADRKNSDYYLLPFAKRNGKGAMLVSGVIIIDALDGHFKEASWTKTPQSFLKINDKDALRLSRQSVLKSFYSRLSKIANPRDYSREKMRILKAYYQMINYINKAKPGLIWQPRGYSNSPYEPYWKVDANGYLFFVTQGGKTFSQPPIEAAIEEILNNRRVLDRFFKK